MDLSGVSSLKLFYSFDEDEGTVTITFKDATETTTFGTITVDTAKHRAFVEALRTPARAYQPDGADDLTKHRISFDKNNNKATLYLP